MKWLLRNIAEFLAIKEYERRIHNTNTRLRAELHECQDMLLDKHAAAITEARQGEINAYLAYITLQRTEERERMERFHAALMKK